jgi:hypothetical protein
MGGGMTQMNLFLFYRVTGLFHPVFVI